MLSRRRNSQTLLFAKRVTQISTQALLTTVRVDYLVQLVKCRVNQVDALLISKRFHLNTQDSRHGRYGYRNLRSV